MDVTKATTADNFVLYRGNLLMVLLDLASTVNHGFGTSDHFTFTLYCDVSHVERNNSFIFCTSPSNLNFLTKIHFLGSVVGVAM